MAERYSYDVFGEPTIYVPNREPRTTSDVGNAYMFTGNSIVFQRPTCPPFTRLRRGGGFQFRKNSPPAENR